MERLQGENIIYRFKTKYYFVALIHRSIIY
jgi:hypothetical protein